MNGHNTLSIMLRKLKLWVRLEASDEEALLNLPHTVSTAPKNKTIITEGDIVVHCYVILSGFCVRYKIVGDGGRQIVSIHMKGDLVDLQNAIVGVADHSIQTLTACKMARIPVAAIHLLCEFALKLEAVSLGGQLEYELPMTQDQLADATGLTPVHVNRTLMDLARMGLIERATPRSVIIGDWQRLAAAGDFSPAYLHLGRTRRSSGTH